MTQPDDDENATLLTRRTFLTRTPLGAAVIASGALAKPLHAHASQSRGFEAADLGAMRDVARAFMAKHTVPGLSVAIARNGRLAFAEGFGMADESKQEQVTPEHLFRIASVSKPITAAAIFCLVEAGKLRLTDRVFGTDALLGIRFGNLPYGRYVGDLTVHHLLTHSAGGWPNDGTDPMFWNSGMDHRRLITWALEKLPLTHTPGTNYAYSNFGYCLLGRVIEAATGRSYAESVRDLVLSPSAATGMRIAGNTLADRAPGEVIYYGQGAEDPYRMQVSRMDAHGGWLATPSDLVRFLLRFDGFPTVPDMLKPATILTMTAPSTANPGYACGWSVNAAPNWWHTGSLPGTTTIMVRTSGGFCWAALTNTRRPNSSMGLDLDNMIWAMVRNVKAWQG